MARVNTPQALKVEAHLGLRVLELACVN
jgi:hypothetical protein